MLTLILLPGMDGTGDLFAPFIAALGHDFHVRCIRYPGSEVLDYQSLEHIASAALPTDGPFILLGESFSGPIALSLAARAPKGLCGLVLCATFARNPRPGLAALRHAAGLIPFHGIPAVLRDFFLLGRFTTPTLRRMLDESLTKVSPSVLHARLRAVLDADVTAALPSIHVPMLYLHASEDRLVPRTAGEWIAQHGARVQLAELNAPHCLLQCAAREAAEHVRAFAHKVRAPDALALPPTVRAR